MGVGYHLWGKGSCLTVMARSHLLHLVDQDNTPDKPEIRMAVEAAYGWSIRDFRNIDEADLAAMAEAVALNMAKRFDEIQSPRRYAFAALMGRIEEWFRRHPAKMVSFQSDGEFDKAIGPDDRFTLEVERKLLFAQIRDHLSERDRLICILLEHGMGRPREIAKVLGLSYKAAHQALQRTKKRMASIVMVETAGTEKSAKTKILTLKLR